MRDTKFRYRIREKGNELGKISFLYVEMAHIENPLMYGNIYWNMFTVLSRDESTGLKDKNGKEIYEGDIISTGHEDNKVRNEVKHGNYEYTHINCCDRNEEHNFYGFYVDYEYLYDEMLQNKIIVLGNIYENPELLKGD